ncbi:S8 family serine peptidase [Paenibacillus sp. TRM 82003]|uniref:S8 family serine peptidase n=1 Tax=Kineococcus sp. TRM81007 TaxID=2925831 RepID=UPI001F56454B|nr:S8 family serine peptidase [Kineococcus sp. TRM81007]MCI2238338.1 S8 family serine peptidase [Kineococcus sp. TRM81007]MCI3923991.1 S8 family serine peptidase [Paenibacillus sp. TRM 82003]
MRKIVLSSAVSVALVAATLAATQTASSADPTTTGAGAVERASRTVTTTGEYVVLYEDGTADDAARAAIEAAGGTVLSSNPEVGYALVRAEAGDFAEKAAAAAGLVGAAVNREIGRAPEDVADDADAIERLTAAERAAAEATAQLKSLQRKEPDAEPLAPLQWDMDAIDATVEGSYEVQQGSRKVTVGVIDTGVDGSHPDIAPNFDAEASRNFVTDIPEIDGECEVEDCVDPADVDGDGHGTHVASTIASPINGLGMAGVAPNVTLVNLRAGQDSGYFFLQPTLDAITYAANTGVDVVNMSFYVDPWLYNCQANPADSPEEQAEQRVIVQSVQRAIDYARSKGVLPVGAAGNESTDLGVPGVDTSSPDYPVDADGNPVDARERTIDNSTCLSVPAESNGVVTVTSTGPSGRKAYYSNYGTEQADVAAPGGDAYDTPDNRVDPAGLILAAYPEDLAIANGDVDEAGEPTTPFVVRQQTEDGEDAYYQYLQGTSMAAPHAAGVAALIVSEYGEKDPAHPGTLTLDPSLTEALLLGTAEDVACPVPAEFTYRRVSAAGESISTATCAGPADVNGFYGQGVVNALDAVTAF